VERDDLVRGFELSKGNYVQITEEEIESLEAEANSAIEFREFVPIEKLDPVYFESTYYLAPSKGAEKPYRLLAETLEKTGRVALAQTVFHEKESLVAVRSHQNGLVMHFYFCNARVFSGKTLAFLIKSVNATSDIHDVLVFRSPAFKD